MKKLLIMLGLLTGSFSVMGANMSNGADNFYTSDKVTVQKVTFRNQYQMMVAGNLFIPKSLDRNARNPAIIVGHPMGAGEPKELFVVPGAGHVDLYDRVNLIPWNKLTIFFRRHFG